MTDNIFEQHVKEQQEEATAEEARFREQVAERDRQRANNLELLRQYVDFLSKQGITSSPLQGVIVKQRYWRMDKQVYRDSGLRGWWISSDRRRDEPPWVVPGMAVLDENKLRLCRITILRDHGPEPWMCIHRPDPHDPNGPRDEWIDHVHVNEAALRKAAEAVSRGQYLASVHELNVDMNAVRNVVQRILGDDRYR